MLSATARPAQISEWTAQAVFAATGRLNDSAVMDIYDVQLPTGKSLSVLYKKLMASVLTPIVPAPTLKEIQVELMKDEQSNTTHVGITSWLATGIKLQEDQ